MGQSVSGGEAEIVVFVSRLHLLSILELRSDSALMQLLIKFLHQTRVMVSARALSCFVRMLDEYYLLSSQERELNQLGRLTEWRRLSSGNLVSFWLHYEQILSSLGGSSFRLSPSFLFIRALKSLDLTAVQSSSILTVWECQGLDHS